jgi:aspartyl-tRNA(Asn)/glutamyl-tRNA(Gln) amidotransferase subunit C
MSEPLSTAEVGRLAGLARLHLPPERLERFRGQMATILDAFAVLRDLDLDAVEPLTHPFPVVNRLDDDVPASSLDPEAVLDLAPAREGPFIAVPKVIDEGAGA